LKSSAKPLFAGVSGVLDRRLSRRKLLRDPYPDALARNRMFSLGRSQRARPPIAME
jgi:hypothetical protein